MASIISATTTNGLSTSADNSGSLQLATNNGTTAVTVDTSQNVGIGVTANSSNKLQVAGDIATSWATDKFIGMKFDTGTSYKMGLMLKDSSRECKVWSQSVDSDDKITFYTGSTPAERMRISSSGDLLVNGSTVYGKQTNFHNSSYVYASVSVGNNADHIIFKSDATTVGSINRVGGTGVIYNTTSDYRLKENIAPITGALATVAQLKPCTYTWKLDGSNGQGFIAHELQTIIPDAVSGEKDAVDENGDIKPQGIDQSRIVATLTAAIQELKAELDATKAEVQALKGVA
jgi:hypothetical protein